MVKAISISFIQAKNYLNQEIFSCCRGGKNVFTEADEMSYSADDILLKLEILVNVCGKLFL